MEMDEQRRNPCRPSLVVCGNNNNKWGLREVLAAARTRSLHCKNDEMKALDEVLSSR